MEHVLLAGLDLSPMGGPDQGGQAVLLAQQVKTFRQIIAVHGIERTLIDQRRKVIMLSSVNVTPNR